MRRRGACGAVVAALSLAVPALALGATRYASPGGTGSACSSGTPCSLTTAVNDASASDSVIVLGGTYAQTAGLNAPAQLTISGQTGVRPVIDMSGAGYLEMDNAGPNAVSNLDLESTGSSSPVDIENTNASHLIVDYTDVDANNGAVILGDSSALLDSAVRSSGTDAVGVTGSGTASSHTETLINDSVYASGASSVGVAAQSSCLEVSAVAEPFPANVVLENVIAHGDGYGLVTTAGESTCTPIPTAALSASYSNYDGSNSANGPVTDNGHNQTAAAQTNPAVVFVSAPTDLHERPGSPTIDAGSTAGIESTDLDNNPRVQGAAPDMGAYETANPVIAPPMTHCVVPKLRHDKLKKARKALASANCTLGKVKRRKHRHHRHKKRRVIKQSVKSGTELAQGAAIGVTLG